MIRISRIAFALLFSVSLGCGTDSTEASPERDGGSDAASLKGGGSDAASLKGGGSDATSTERMFASDGAPLPQNSGSDAPRSYGSSPCAQCVAGACSAELTACTGDPDCTNYLDCLNACPVGPTGAVSDACEQACPTGATTSGADAERQLVLCMTAGGGSQCATCGADAATGAPILRQQCSTPTSFVNGCDRCSQAHCCMTNANCQADPQCIGYLGCIVSCPTSLSDDAGTLEGGPVDSGTADGPVDIGSLDGGFADGSAPPVSPGACEEACAQQYPPGRAEWAALAACTTVYCGGPSDCDDMASPCLQCTTSHCADEYANYAGTSDGFALAFCIAGCAATDDACETACSEKYPGAIASSTAVNECALEKCPACQAP